MVYNIYYLRGDIGVTWFHGFKLSETDYARHEPILSFSSLTELRDDDLSVKSDGDLSIQSDDFDLVKGLSEDAAERLKKLLKENKI